MCRVHTRKLLVGRLKEQLPPWNSFDDECWFRNKLWCSFLKYVKPKEAPPRECGYIYEHAVMGDGNG